jgi:hypothetical protein
MGAAPYTKFDGMPLRKPTRTWKIAHDGEDEVCQVGVWALFCGHICDLAARNKLMKTVGWAGLLGCDMCTMVGQKAGFKATKKTGYAQYPSAPGVTYM